MCNLYALKLIGWVLPADCIDPATGELIAKAGTEVNVELARRIAGILEYLAARHEYGMIAGFVRATGLPE